MASRRVRFPRVPLPFRGQQGDSVSLDHKVKFPLGEAPSPNLLSQELGSDALTS